MRHFAVLAGNLSQFLHWTSQGPWRRYSGTRVFLSFGDFPEIVEAHYIGAAEHSWGIMFTDVIIYGTFWERPDAHEIHEAVSLRLNQRRPEDTQKAVDLILFCPMCHVRHVDEGKWAHELHRTHECQACGFRWAPASVPTRGVLKLPG